MLADLSTQPTGTGARCLVSTTRPVSPWDRADETDKARALRLLRGLVSWSAQGQDRLAATMLHGCGAPPWVWKCGVVGMVRQLWPAALQQRGEPGWKVGVAVPDGGRPTPRSGCRDGPAGRWIWEASRLDPPPCGPGRRGRPGRSCVAPPAVGRRKGLTHGLRHLDRGFG
jgi:hypothetical protein